MANKFSKEPSLGIPQLAMIVECPDHSDKVNGDLNSDCFFILGTDINWMSVKEIKTWIDTKGDLTGCGFTGCTITLAEALVTYLEGMQAPCYSCPTNTIVDITEGCRIHEDKKLSYLAIVSAMKFARWYNNRALGLIVINITIPFVKIGDQRQH